MKKESNNSNPKIIFIIFSILIIFILIILGFSFPKGIYGIKPLKTVSYFATPMQSYGESNTKVPRGLIFFLIILLILSIIYLVLHPRELASYIIAIIFLFLIFFILPRIMQLKEEVLNDNEEKIVEIKEIEKNLQQTFETEKIETEPIAEKEEKNSKYLFFLILISLLIVFVFCIVIIFLAKIINRIIKELKNGEFFLFMLKDKKKKKFVSEIKNVIISAIQLFDSENSIKTAIINCYLALLYSVKKYAKESKDPSYTSREFIPTLLSIGLDSYDINTITLAFEKAKYSNTPIDKEEKDIVLKSLKNCIIKLKKR